MALEDQKLENMVDACWGGRKKGQLTSRTEPRGQVSMKTSANSKKDKFTPGEESVRCHGCHSCVSAAGPS